MKAKSPSRHSSSEAPASDLCFHFPVHGCAPAKPMTREQIEKKQAACLNAIKRNWENDGVKAIIELLEIKAATLQGRSCARGADQHDAGQAFSLLQLVGELQNKRWQT